MEKTFAIIKPDAVERRRVGAILARIEAEGFEIVALRQMRLSEREAQGFYSVHRERPFFGDLVRFMCSGPCVAMILSGPAAISRWREVMGATDPAKAAPGTIRREHGTNIERNATHGSDAPETAAFETAYFFSGRESAV